MGGNLFDPLDGLDGIDATPFVFVHHISPTAIKYYRCGGDGLQSFKSPTKSPKKTPMKTPTKSERHRPLVPHIIFTDDTILCVKEKLVAYILPTIHPSHIFAWYQKSPSKTGAIGVNFKTADGSQYEGPCNPFDASFAALGNIITDYSADDERLLNEFKTMGEVHFTTYGDMEAFLDESRGNRSMLRYCFPSFEKHSGNNGMASRIAADELIMQKYCNMSATSSSHKFEIAASVISASLGEVAVWHIGFDLHRLFEFLSTDERWPMMRLVVSGSSTPSMQNMYKLHTPALRYGEVHHVSDVQLRRWTVPNAQARQSFIEVMVSYLPGVFALLRLYQTHNPKRIIAELRLNAHKNGFVEFGQGILEPGTNGGFGTNLRSLIAEIAEVLGPPDVVNTSEFRPSKLRTSMNIHSKSVVPDIQTLTALISDLSPIVVLMPSDTPGAISMIYKRVPNMRAIANVNHVLALFAKHKDWATVSKSDIVQNVFGYDESETQQVLQDVRRYNNYYARNNKTIPPEIRITKNAVGQMAFSIQWVGDVQTHRAIMTLLRYLVFFSDPKKSYKTPQNVVHHPTSMSPQPDDMDLMFAFKTPDQDQVDYNGQDVPRDLNKHSFQKYALKSLQRADPKVFDASYSRTCQKSANRQPIVISKTELDRIDREYPGSYFNNFINNFGSDDSARRRNIYICPEIWCPLSRVSMTSAQLSASGNKCPNPNEKVMHIDNKYFQKADADASKPRFASFSKKSGKCYPCCFAPSSIETARVKHNKSVEECSLASNPETKDKGIQGKIESDRYIKGAQYPLESGRYGVLPAIANETLPEMQHPQGPGGTGNIARGTDCLVRVGVNDGDLVKSIEWLLLKGQPTEKPRGGVVGTIVSNLTMEMFMVLNQGRLMRMLIKDGNLTPHARKRFDEWVNGTTMGQQFAKSFVSKQGDTYETEFIMWSAMENFKRYLADEEVRKTEDTILDACNRKEVFGEWEGRHPIIILCEVDDDGKFMVVCDAYGDFDATDLANQEFAFILKQAQNFEPLCRVHNATKGGMTVTHRFNLGDYPPADIVIETYMKNVNRKLDPLCCTRDVQYQVLDYNFRVVGIVSKSGNYRNIDCCEPLVGRPGRPLFLFVDQVHRYVKQGLDAEFIERSNDDRNIFVRKALPDPRVKYQTTKQHDGDLMARMRDAILRLHVRKLSNYIDELKTAATPFFEEKTRLTDKINGLVGSGHKRIMPSLPDDQFASYLEKIVMEIMLNDRLPQITHNIRKKMMSKAINRGEKDESLEVVFDQRSVDSGRLWKRFANLTNPYLCCPNPSGTMMAT
jgi:hypothetical protein